MSDFLSIAIDNELSDLELISSGGMPMSTPGLANIDNKLTS
jgi:hypothetical protein